MNNADFNTYKSNVRAAIRKVKSADRTAFRKNF